MKKLLSTICAIILFFASTTAVSGCAASGYIEFGPTAAFSGDIVLTAKIIGGRADWAYARMSETVAAINSEVSATLTTSALYKFNNAGENERVEIGEHFDALFLLAREYYAATDGAFDPAVAPLAKLWHVDAESIAEYRPSVDGTHVSPELPSYAEVSAVRALCDFSAVERTVENGKVYLSKPDARIKLDFGGIAKGYAVDKCVEILDEYSIASALIDISGNAYFYGDYVGSGKSDGTWKVGVVSPRPRAGESVDGIRRGNVCAVALNGGVSAVTSGDYMRYYIHDGEGGAVYVPHIIGKDGVPVGVYYDDGWKNSNDSIISATVIGASSAQCDALSTAVCALGLDEGARLLQKSGLKGLIFTSKRFTIVGDVALYATDDYDGYKAYERV